MDITVDDLIKRYPATLSTEEVDRAETLISDALRKIRVEFLKRGRDLDVEIAHNSWLYDTAFYVVLDLVSEALLVGENALYKHVSSQTGQESDAFTYRDGIRAKISGISITDDVLEALGLVSANTPSGSFPGPMRYPEVIAYGAYRDYR